MKAKIILLVFTLFFASMQFYGQGINSKASVIFNTPTSSTGNSTMNEGIQAQTDVKSAEDIIESLRLKLTCDVNSYRDEAFVVFNDSDPTQGAAKLMSFYATAPEIWSVKNGLKYSISFLGGLDSTIIVPITVKAGVPGNYTITASQIESFGSTFEISLEDRFLGSFVKLAAFPEYVFEVSEASTIPDRFYLHFVDITSDQDKEPTSVGEKEVAQDFNMYSVDGVIKITSLQQQSGKVAVFDMQGRVIAKSWVGAGASSQIDMHGKQGVYIVNVLSSKGISKTKILVH